MNNKLCIYTSTPASYDDVFNVFIELFNKNWPNCPYPIVISTNSQKHLSDRYIIKVIHANPDNWVKRTLMCLPEIDYEYVLIIMDDAVIMRQFDDSIIDTIVHEMDSYQLNYCKMTGVKKGLPYKNSKVLNRVRKDTPYARNLFMGIFRKSYLLELLGDGTLSAWELEEKWLNEARKSSDNEYYEDIVICNKTIIPVCNGVAKGKWLPSVKKNISTLGIYVDNKRPSISTLNEFKMNLGSKLGLILSPKARLFCKKFLSSLGVKFASKS